MNKKNIAVPLELLLLNDLLHQGVIDERIYDKAVRKIVETKNITQISEQPQTLIMA